MICIHRQYYFKSAINRVVIRTTTNLYATIQPKSQMHFMESKGVLLIIKHALQKFYEGDSLNKVLQ